MSIPQIPLMIAGDAAAHGEHTVTSPYNGQALARIARADEQAVEQALQHAHAAFRNRAAWLDRPQRIAILEKTATLLAEQAETFARQAAQEGGKPLIDSRIEVTRAVDSLRVAVDTLRTGSATPPAMGVNAACADHHVLMMPEPIGVVVAFSAFNHPVNLIVHQIAPAIASACPVIVKPAADTAISCFRLVELLYQAGLPAAWCQALLPENHALAERLVCDPRVAFFSFIGSSRVGWMLRSRLAPGTRCALEHGGVAPVIVAEDADLEALLPGLVKGAFYHAGQVCVSVQRVYAQRRIARQLADALAERAKQLVVGDPLDEHTEVGPLIRPAEVTRVHDWVQQAIAAGAACLSGGSVLPNQCYAPTVLYDPPADTAVSQQEVFGPVVCVTPYDDVEQALELANGLDVAFQAAVYTRDLDTALSVGRRLDASAVMVNEHTAFRVDWMPFAGLRHSGLGTGGIPHTMADMQVQKMLVIKSS